MYLSKSDFLKYQVCPSYFWLWKNKRDVVPRDADNESVKQRLEQGNKVEEYARQLFPGGKLAEGRFAQAQKATEKLLKDNAEIIFQATVITDNGLLAMADVLERDDEGWILYEIKSTNTPKVTHINDLAFQQAAFETAGYTINSTKIIHLNKNYTLGNHDVNPGEVFKTTDVSHEVLNRAEEVHIQIKDALQSMIKETEPDPVCAFTSNHHNSVQLLNTFIQIFQNIQSMTFLVLDQRQ